MRRYRVRSHRRAASLDLGSGGLLLVTVTAIACIGVAPRTGDEIVEDEASRSRARLRQTIDGELDFTAILSSAADDDEVHARVSKEMNRRIGFLRWSGSR